MKHPDTDGKDAGHPEERNEAGAGSDPPKSPFEVFEEFARKVISVPRSTIEERERAYKENRNKPKPEKVSKSGMVRKTLWLHGDEADALREKAYQERRAESEIVREALRAYLRIED